MSGRRHGRRRGRPRRPRRRARLHQRRCRLRGPGDRRGRERPRAARRRGGRLARAARLDAPRPRTRRPPGAEAGRRVRRPTRRRSTSTTARVVAGRYNLGGATVQREALDSPVAVVAAMPKVFEAGEPPAGAAGEVVAAHARRLTPSAVKVVERQPKEGETVDLAAAPRIVAVGRGLGKREDLPLGTELASAFGGELGCTKSLADFGWLPEDRIIGLSGAKTAPDVYLAVGISGQVQHTVGCSQAQGHRRRQLRQGGADLRARRLRHRRRPLPGRAGAGREAQGAVETGRGGGGCARCRTRPPALSSALPPPLQHLTWRDAIPELPASADRAVSSRRWMTRAYPPILWRGRPDAGLATSCARPGRPPAIGLLAAVLGDRLGGAVADRRVSPRLSADRPALRRGRAPRAVVRPAAAALARPRATSSTRSTRGASTRARGRSGRVMWQIATAELPPFAVVPVGTSVAAAPTSCSSACRRSTLVWGWWRLVDVRSRFVVPGGRRRRSGLRGPRAPARRPRRGEAARLGARPHHAAGHVRPAYDPRGAVDGAPDPGDAPAQPASPQAP